jgi:hypothetical protein
MLDAPCAVRADDGGCRAPSPASLLDALASDEAEADVDVGVVCSALCQIHLEHSSRLLADAAWCAAFAAAAAAAGAGASGAVAARVLVVGQGSAVPALAAARAGCDVVWAERVVLSTRSLEDVLSRLAQANGVRERVRVVRVQQWAELERLTRDGRRFDLVLTEEIGDDPLSDGILSIAALARTSLLTPSGTFAPSRLRLRGQLFSARTTARAGFDLRAFDACRTTRAFRWTDAEHLALVEGAEHAHPLSAPLLLLEVQEDQRSPKTHARATALPRASACLPSGHP